MKKKQPNHLKLLIPLSVFAVLAIVWLMKGPAVSGSPLFQYDWNVYLPLITNNYVSPPPASASHYMVYPISSSNLTNEGCAEGQASRGNVVVVLD